MPPQLQTDAAGLARTLAEFLSVHPHACVVEEGRTLFELAGGRWSLDGSQGRCVLQLWNEETTLSRTVTAVEVRRGGLRLEVRRFGQAKPQVLRLIPGQQTRTPSAREAGRKRYARLLGEALTRSFSDLRLGETTTAADLEHSFGPAYVRGMLDCGRTRWAFVGVDGAESQATIDGALTVAILWLAHCRERVEGRRVLTGLKLILPAGAAATVQERMQWLHPDLAKWELYTFDPGAGALTAQEPADGGNQRSRLVHAFRPEAVMARSRAAIERVLQLIGPADRSRVEVLARSPSEIVFSLHGLVFAQVRHSVGAQGFNREDQIVFGAGAHETPLTDETAPRLREMTAALFRARHTKGNSRDPLYRMQPEQWLESLLRADLAALEPALLPAPVYTQVPAMTAGERGMLDLLAVTREGRLTVLELKTSEDMFLPMQGLDYWMRVRALHANGALTRAGYFPGIELSPEPPQLCFVVPALHVHPSFDIVVRHLSPQVNWRLLALDERWRERRSVVFRKNSGSASAAARRQGSFEAAVSPE